MPLSSNCIDGLVLLSSSLDGAAIGETQDFACEETEGSKVCI